MQEPSKLLDYQEAWREAILEELGSRTRAWLAEESGLDAATITRILNGTVVPTDTAKWRIAGALGVRVDKLFRYPSIIPQKTWREPVAS